MTDMIRHIRIFVSSPNDVNEERKLALDVIDHLLYEPLFREKVAFNVIAWDRPGSGTPLLATMTPQAAINAGLPLPSQCDIVVVIFHSRMGTPLPAKYTKSDGSPYLSGTEWEYEDALQAALSNGRPELIVYRRSEPIMLNPDDPEFKAKVTQYQRVKDFFAKFHDENGAFLQGYNQYEKPEDFRRDFESHLRITVEKLLRKPSLEFASNQQDEKLELSIWEGSPFPGLEAFSEKQAPIFFGRGREIDSLVEKIRANRFVAVVGASGSGKSSLVAAGLVPRLKSNAISSKKSASKDWLFLRLTPRDNPYLALAEALINTLPTLSGDPIEFAQRVQRLSDILKAKPDNMVMTIHHALRDSVDWAEVLIFVDQFEELFTQSSHEIRETFTNMLTYPSDKVRVVVTLRSDFYHRAVEIQTLADRLREGSLPLAMPDQFALLEMIEQPAKRAALIFQKNLAQRIVQDTGNEPGALALMAYALDELYQNGKNKRELTHIDYESIGSVQGAIGKRAQTAFDILPLDAQATISFVFRELVEVDERGIATRQRTAYSRFTNNSNAVILISAFIKARLLVASRGALSINDPSIEVAHEALLRSWPRLAQWIEDTQDDLRLLRQVRHAAREWNEAGRPTSFLWQHERLQPVYDMQERLRVEFDEVVQAFIQPEGERLFSEFKRLSEEESLRTMLYRQMNIVDRFAAIGKPAIRYMLASREFASGSTIDAIDKVLKSIGNLPSDIVIKSILESRTIPLNMLVHFYDGKLPEDFPNVFVNFFKMSSLSKEVRARACQAIIELKLEILIQPLAEILLSETDATIQNAILGVLSRTKAKNMDVVLRKLIDAPDPNLNTQVLQIAADFGFGSTLISVKHILQLYSHNDLDNANRQRLETILKGIVHPNYPTVIEEIISALESGISDTPTLVMLIKVISFKKIIDASSYLIKLAVNHYDQIIRDLCRKTLTTFGKQYELRDALLTQ